MMTIDNSRLGFAYRAFSFLMRAPSSGLFDPHQHTIWIMHNQPHKALEALRLEQDAVIKLLLIFCGPLTFLEL